MTGTAGSGSPARERLSRNVAMARDAAIGAAGVTAAVLQGIVGHWVGVAATLLAAASWITARRLTQLRLPQLRVPQRRIHSGRVAQIAFVVMGLGMVWRLALAWLPLAVAGMWLLVTAADLDRFTVRYPFAAALPVQRQAFRRRLTIAAYLGLASAVTVAAAAALTLRLRLVSVMLLAAFVVVVIFRLLRDVAGSTDQSGNGRE